MAIASDQIEVGTEATVIIANDVDGQSVVIRNMASNNSMFIGDSGVTISNGYELVKDSSIELFLGPGEEIYGVVEEDTEEACYIATMNQ